MWGVIDNFSKCPQKKWQKERKNERIYTYSDIYLHNYMTMDVVLDMVHEIIKMAIEWSNESNKKKKCSKWTIIIAKGGTVRLIRWVFEKKK